jgi:hypothetical protein
MTLYSQFIYSLILFIINNNHIFNFINESHKPKTRSLNNLYLPTVNVIIYSKGAYVAGIKAISRLPQSTRQSVTKGPEFVLRT